MKPLTHYLQAVLFISGWYGRYFRLESTVVPLFAGTTYLYFRRTRATLPPEQQPFKKEITEAWLDDPERAAQEISDIVEHEAFPAIADLTSPEALDRRPDYSEDYIDPALGACFNDDFDRAERLIVEYMAKEKTTLADGRLSPYSLELVTEAHRDHEHSDWRIAYLGKLLQTDRSQIPGLLHEWEEISVNALKLNKYWTRTPFPCEQGKGAAG